MSHILFEPILFFGRVDSSTWSIFIPNVEKRVFVRSMIFAVSSFRDFSVQYICASSWTNWITRISPPSTPDSSTRCTHPSSPTLSGRSLYDFGEVLYISIPPGQFIGLIAKSRFSYFVVNIPSLNFDQWPDTSHSFLSRICGVEISWYPFVRWSSLQYSISLFFIWRPFGCQNTIPGAELLKLHRSIFLPMILWSFSLIFVVSNFDF